MKKQVINYKKLELVGVVAPESAIQPIEDLMIFDARCLDKETRLELVRLLPELTHIRSAWKAYFTVHGCVSCRRKRTQYLFRENMTQSNGFLMETMKHANIDTIPFHLHEPSCVQRVDAFC